MYRFNNDYNRGACPEILEALGRENGLGFDGYGEDTWCRRGADTIRELVGRADAAVHFLPGATQANFVVIAAALNSVQSVIAADTGHITCHEAASVEHTGRKIEHLPNREGKISAEQIAELAESYYAAGEPEYKTEPKLVYLSFPTEQGTLYSKAELTAISETCRKYGMYLFVDGARMAYGLAARENDLTLRDFGTLADAFYLGGTKCGALFGEALVLTAEPLKRRFKAYMKQNGAVLAKGWLLGLQFSVLLEQGLYLENARRADDYAMELRAAFLRKGIPLWVDSPTNQQFVLLTEAQKRALAPEFLFEEQGESEGRTVARFCTSWATSREELDALLGASEKL